MSSLSIGIVGLPNVGKSTLFNALTQKSVPAENYPFCTIDPSVGVVAVPDDRLYKLAEFSKTEKTIPAVVEFVDIAGLVEGASKGEGLGNQFLSHIRETDAILHLVRIFDLKDSTNTEQHHVYGSVDPIRDIRVIFLELILADLESVKKRREKIIRDVKRGDKDAIILDSILIKIEKTLEEEKLANQTDLNKDEIKLINDLHLLTAKPVLFGLNKKSGGNNLDEQKPEEFKKIIIEIEKYNSGWILIDAKTEHELSGFSSDEKSLMREELDDKHDGINDLIKNAYTLLGLETYFTTGVKETRAWTIKKGSTGPVAGAAIHSDFEKKYIRAEVIAWDKLIEAGSFAEARSRGLLRTEGKEYIVKDGDVIEFKI